MCSMHFQLSYVISIENTGLPRVRQRLASFFHGDDFLLFTDMEDDGDHLMDFEPDVFESKFLYWRELPSHLKIQVLRNLPYPTLRNFMFLSKECWNLTASFKTEAYAVYLDEMAFLSELQDVR